MALTLVIEDGSGLANSNSYATRAEGTTYFEGRLYVTGWTNATNADKDAALVWATDLIDDWVDWHGSRTSEDQALRWPRFSVKDPDGYVLDSDSIPTFLKDAVAEQALFLLAGDPTAEPDTKGFKRLKVDVLELEVDKLDRDATTVIPDVVMAIVGSYGRIRSRGGGGTIKLIRA